MDRYCVNSKAADQYAHQIGEQDDIELAIERLEIEWFDDLEEILQKSSNPILAEFIDQFSDQIGELLRKLARDHVMNLPEL